MPSLPCLCFSCQLRQKSAETCAIKPPGSQWTLVFSRSCRPLWITQALSPVCAGVSGSFPGCLSLPVMRCLPPHPSAPPAPFRQTLGKVPAFPLLACQRLASEGPWVLTGSCHCAWVVQWWACRRVGGSPESLLLIFSRPGPTLTLW